MARWCRITRELHSVNPRDGSRAPDYFELLLMPIHFYSNREEYGAFSNFSRHGFEMDGKWYSTVEHYYQAMKFRGHEIAERIRTAQNPMSAKKLGNSREAPIREDWNNVKLDVMRAALGKKFSTHSKLRRLLTETGDEKLVECSRMDYFWGCGESGTGENWLGRLLMELREEMRNSRALFATAKSR